MPKISIFGTQSILSPALIFFFEISSRVTFYFVNLNLIQKFGKSEEHTDWLTNKGNTTDLLGKTLDPKERSGITDENILQQQVERKQVILKNF